jgi:hypothetical protein
MEVIGVMKVEKSVEIDCSAIVEKNSFHPWKKKQSGKCKQASDPLSLYCNLKQGVVSFYGHESICFTYFRLSRLCLSQ